MASRIFVWERKRQVGVLRVTTAATDFDGLGSRGRGGGGGDGEAGAVGAATGCTESARNILTCHFDSLVE